MPHVRPTSHHRGQPDRGWTPHRRHGNGSRPMHMDWTACLLESSTMMRPAVRSVHEAGEISSRFAAALSTITPIHEPWQEEPRFTVSPNRDIDANDPFERNGAVIAHRYRATPRIGGDPFPPCQSTSTARPHSSRRTYRPAPSARRAEHSRAIPASLHTSLLISFSYLRKTLPSCAKTILKYIVTIVKSFVK